jgi:CheY-like chemotaxis protein
MLSKRKILVVEDNAGNRLLLKYNLEGYFDIDFAGNGLSALNKLSTSKYDLILMDIHMPDMDGIETTRNIRKMENEGIHTPIFIVTSNMCKELKQQCIDAGVDDYIVKPIHAKALVERINQYFSTSAHYHYY